MRLLSAAFRALLCGLLVGASLTAAADTVRIANQADALSMDPHSLDESLQLSLTGNVYEPLVGRQKDLGLMPLLATAWRQTAPLVWRFELRQGVSFHDGTPFGADDVVFSFQRAAGEGSDMRSHLSEIREVRKAGDAAVEIETRAPSPILPELISQLYIMSRKWCETNQALRPVDRRQGIENAASFRANGTGPFRLRERLPDEKTVFVRHTGYWGAIEGNASEIVFLPIRDDAARVAALLSGEVDVMEPVPVADIARVNASSGARVVTGPELRTLFLGMDQWRDELLYASVKGRNPFKDRRVRQAFYQAIDIEAIRKTVMRGAATPTALMVGPGINGFQPALNKRLPYDLAAARRLMAQAGYAQGFALDLDCPNDRYVNDARICQALAGQLARINLRIRLQVQPKSSYFPKLLRRDTSFYLLGWAPGSYDAHNVLNALMACPDEQGAGQYNLGGYCNPRVDELARRIAAEADRARRNALIREALELHAADIGHIPLHQQALAWGVSRRVSLVQMPDNAMPFRYIAVKQALRAAGESP